MVRYENRAILDGAIAVARGTRAGAVLLAAKLAEETAYLEQALAGSARVIGMLPAEFPSTQMDDEVIVLPQVRLRRRGRAKVALLEAMAAGLVEAGERVVVISGDQGNGAADLDTVALIDLSEEGGVLAGQDGPALETLSRAADPAVFDALLGLCIELARQGRYRRPVGFLATLGAHEAVMARSHPLILNPFEGHPPRVRCLLFPVARRAVREFSGIDGAFVVQGDGLIVAAGRYLEGRAPEDRVPAGLGARHRAAAGITAVTGCIAFVVSETSGEVRLFSGGRLIMTLSPDD